MKSLILKLYQLLPKRYINLLGQSALLKPLRNFLLRQNDNFKEIGVKIEREYLNYKVKFNFFASIKVAEKAKNRGIENKLLRSSIELLCKLGIEKDAFIFDVGASFGYLSLVWANSVCKDNGMLFSFEPHPNVYSTFQKSIVSNNLSNLITPEKYAVSNENGEVEINLSETSANVNDASQQTIKKLVKKITIDTYIERKQIQKCSLIKIDVDGYEYNVLAGANKTIDNFKPVLIVESNNDKRIVEFLENKNYMLLDMNLKSYKLTDNMPPNFFCISNDYNWVLSSV